MATRAFTDREGEAWRVWDTIPQDPRGCLPAFARGWLTFEQATSGTRRRLAPIPAGWSDASEERLHLLCRAADPVRAIGRQTTGDGAAAVADEDGARRAATHEGR